MCFVFFLKSNDRTVLSLFTINIVISIINITIRFNAIISVIFVLL